MTGRCPEGSDCPNCTEPQGKGRGSCPWSIPCPKCGAAPGKFCRGSKRPSGHNLSRGFSGKTTLCEERYRTTERADAATCPGFEANGTPAGVGCKHCSGLPDDHPSEQTDAEAHRPEEPQEEAPMSQGSFDFGPDGSGPYHAEKPPAQDPRGRKKKQLYHVTRQAPDGAIEYGSHPHYPYGPETRFATEADGSARRALLDWTRDRGKAQRFFPHEAARYARAQTDCKAFVTEA